MAINNFIRCCLVAAVSLACCGNVQAQLQPGTKADSIAQAKVLELVEKEHLLTYYDDNINTPGDFIYSSQVATRIKQRPGKDLSEYWVQVIDHRIYDTPNIFLNFYVDPKTWQVYYLDTKTDHLWTWENWKKHNRYRS